eukprot:GGOE01049353.1.p2 GENE.GGOE01049353.1~~GGOE01049353.1.p2  ORF type:complete len:324 (-),score=80.37 GGOE01049353.1:258-1199(-)
MSKSPTPQPIPATVSGLDLELATPKPDITDRICGLCTMRRCVRSHWWCPSYIADWVVVAILGIAVIIEITLWKPNVRPYQAATMLATGTFSFNDNEFQFVTKSDTFKEWVTAIISIGLPCLLMLVYFLWRWFGPAKDRSLHDLHHFLLGMATSVAVAYFAWIPVNRVCGSFRPDFWYRLQTGDADTIEQGRESFPSGHTLAAFVGLGFFMHWLSGKLFVFHSSGGHLWRFVLAVMCPMALAITQAVSRVTDNRHRTVDILGGAVIGMGSAICGYHLNYPPMWAPDCNLPKNRRQPYLRQLLAGIAAKERSEAE